MKRRRARSEVRARTLEEKLGECGITILNQEKT